MDKHSFLEIYQQNQSHVDHFLSTIWTKYSVPCDSLLSAMKFALDGPSKRIRGTLCLLISRAITGKNQHQNINSLTLSSILEIIHAYSLIHDDLPSMDNSPMRRGKPSCHVQFGEGMAILAGDALLTYAFEQLLHLEIPPQNIISMGKILSQVCGAQGMVGGQALDIQFQQDSFLQESILQSIHEKKTGDLIRASVVLPAYIYEKEDSIKELNQLGALLGLLFQIKDDISDAAKPTIISSEKEGPNYVFLFGLGRAQEKLKQVAQKSIQIVKTLDIPQPEILNGICEFMAN